MIDDWTLGQRLWVYAVDIDGTTKRQAIALGRIARASEAAAVSIFLEKGRLVTDQALGEMIWVDAVVPAAATKIDSSCFNNADDLALRHADIGRRTRELLHPHIINGEFKSDKYPECPAGKVPLSTKDPTAQDLLWEYAQRRRAVDDEFADDLEYALRLKGYTGPKKGRLL